MSQSLREFPTWKHDYPILSKGTSDPTHYNQDMGLPDMHVRETGSCIQDLSNTNDEYGAVSRHPKKENSTPKYFKLI